MNRQQGIPALAAGALLALAGCAAYDTGSTPNVVGNRGAYMATIDDQATHTIEQAPRADHAIDSRNVRVAVIRGVAHVDGTVRSDAERTRVLDIARNTDGVSRIEDNLRTAG